MRRKRERYGGRERYRGKEIKRKEMVRKRKMTRERDDKGRCEGGVTICVMSDRRERNKDAWQLEEVALSSQENGEVSIRRAALLRQRNVRIHCT